ncbi:MAG: alcohol dehydrogenase catalytic domain-containing protein [Sedimentisphaerales bacterium]|nr:alcohol dehydrogenase catalytic domain-containing protein [Sedimentisphaerales bacterium]
MKAMFLTDLRKMELRDVPEPVIEKDDQVLIKIERVGVCGSDVHYYETGRIGSQVVEYPYLVGHECSATVIEAGSAVTRVRQGDQVAVEPAMPCHHCEQCRVGRENTCYNLGFLGTPGQADGCLCEYLVMPEECLFPLNGRISLDQAALCEPLSIGLYSAKQANLAENAEIAILGSGPIGLTVLASALAQGIKNVYMTDKINPRLEAARQIGAAWVGNPDSEDVVAGILEQRPLGLDAVFECAGEQETIDQALNLLKPGGKIILVGIPRIDRISFRIDLLRRREVTIINIRRQNNCVQPAIDLIASGKINIGHFITHRFPLEQSQEAFELVAGYRDGVIKAMIDFPL